MCVILVQIGLVVLEIQGAEKVIPVNKTCVPHSTRFSDTLLCLDNVLVISC